MKNPCAQCDVVRQRSGEHLSRSDDKLGFIVDSRNLATDLFHDSDAGAVGDTFLPACSVVTTVDRQLHEVESLHIQLEAMERAFELQEAALSSSGLEAAIAAAKLTSEGQVVSIMESPTGFPQPAIVPVESRELGTWPSQHDLECFPYVKVNRLVKLSPVVRHVLLFLFLFPLKYFESLSFSLLVSHHASVDSAFSSLFLPLPWLLLLSLLSNSYFCSLIDFLSSSSLHVTLFIFRSSPFIAVTGWSANRPRGRRATAGVAIMAPPSPEQHGVAPHC